MTLRLATGALLLIAATKCVPAQPARSAVEYVPAKTVAVVAVNWRAVRGDDSLRRIANGDDFPAVVRQMGIDERNVSEFVIFADATPTTANKLGMFISGRFSTEDVTRNAVSKGWSHEAIGSRTAYRNPADSSIVLALRPGLIVAGTRSGVERAAATFASPRTGISKKRDFSAIFSQLGASSPIRFFLGVPQEYQLSTKIGYFVLKKLLGIGFFTPLGVALNAIGLIQSVGLSISAGEETLPVHLVAQMPGAIRASLASSGLNYLRSTAAVMPTADADAIRAMSVSSTGRYLSIKMKMPSDHMLPAR